jgi:hypothetical protein
MSEDGNKWEEIKTRFRFWLAGLAIQWCGIPTLYWSAAEEWETFFKTGEPLLPEAQQRSS